MNYLLPAALLLALSQLASRGLGVLRDHVFARIFGATGGEGLWNIDTYYAAFRLPDLVYNLLVFGAVSAAFLPLLTSIRGKKAQARFTSNVLHTLLLALIAVLALVYLAATPLTQLIAPGFDAVATAQTADLLRIQLLAPLFFAASAILTGLAQHAHRFAWYALAPLFYNASIVVAALFFAEEYGVVALAWGTVVGAGLHAAIQLPLLFGKGFSWQPIIAPRALADFFRLALPRVAAIGAGQLQFVLITIFASLVGTGALAVFNYAWNLASLPFGLIGLVLATTSFAAFSRLAGSPRLFAIRVGEDLTRVLFFAVPAAAGLFVLREEIVALVLGFGNFTEMDIFFTAEALGVLAVSVPFFSMLPLLNNAFFAQKNTRVPLVAGLLSLVALFVACDLAVPVFEATGLAVGYAVAGIVGASFLWYRLRRIMPLPLGAAVARIAVATVLLTLALSLVSAQWHAAGLLELVAQIGILSVAGAGLYFSVTQLLGISLRNIIHT